MDERDAEIVGAVRGGDREAFGGLVDRYERYVHAIALSILGRPEAALDVVQDAFLLAFRRLSQLEDPRRFRSWLAGIARHQAIDALRQRKGSQPMSDIENLPTVHDDGGDPGRALASAEVGARILETIGTLPESYQVPIVLRYVDRKSYRDIALATGESVDSVRGLLYRGNRLLRQRLADLMEDVR